MKRSWAAALLALGVGRAASAAEALPAAPAPPPPVVLVEPLPAAPPPAEGGAGAPLAGMATAVVPFVAGCLLWADNGNAGAQRAGTIIMATGFAAAPWVSHGLQRRWKRGAIFGSIATGLSAATLGLMAWKDPFNPDYKNRERVPFGVLLTAAMFAGAAGIFDSFLLVGDSDHIPPP
jgi:hypothetical protein